MTWWKDRSSRLLALGCLIAGFQILASSALIVASDSPRGTPGYGAGPSTTPNPYQRGQQ